MVQKIIYEAKVVERALDLESAELSAQVSHLFSEWHWEG